MARSATASSALQPSSVFMNRNVEYKSLASHCSSANTKRKRPISNSNILDSSENEAEVAGLEHSIVLVDNAKQRVKSLRNDGLRAKRQRHAAVEPTSDTSECANEKPSLIVCLKRKRTVTGQPHTKALEASMTETTCANTTLVEHPLALPGVNPPGNHPIGDGDKDGASDLEKTKGGPKTKTLAKHLTPLSNVHHFTDLRTLRSHNLPSAALTASDATEASPLNPFSAQARKNPFNATLSEIATAAAAVPCLEGRIADLKRSNENYELMLSCRNKQVNTLEGRIKELAQQLSNERKEHAKSEARLKKKLSDLEKKVKKHEEVASSMTGLLEGLNDTT